MVCKGIGTFGNCASMQGPTQVYSRRPQLCPVLLQVQPPALHRCADVASCYLAAAEQLSRPATCASPVCVQHAGCAEQLQLFVYSMQDVPSSWAVWPSLFVNAGPTCTGTWKARIETLMESDAARRGPQPAPHLPGRPRVVMHIDMVSRLRLVVNTTVGMGRLAALTWPTPLPGQAGHFIRFRSPPAADCSAHPFTRRTASLHPWLRQPTLCSRASRW